jgi:putative PEP-CTERM system histidine kinase
MISMPLLLSGANAALAFSFLLVFSIRHHKAGGQISFKPFFIGVLLWASTYGALYAVIPEALFIGMAADLIKDVAIANLALSFIKNKINVPKYLFYSIAISLLLIPFILLSNLNSYWMTSLYGMAGIIFCVSMLLLCERSYHVCSSQENKNGLHLVFGIVVIVSVEFFSYCDTIFSSAFNIQNIQWKMTAMLFSLPLIYRGINSLRKTPLRLTISRPLAFHGSLFVIIGSYLIAVSLLTSMSSYFGFQWDHTSQSILFGAALIPLSYLFMSQRIRSEIRVWVNKHFFAGQFDYRKTWLKLLEDLDPSLTGQQATSCGLKSTLKALNHTRGAFYLFDESTSSLRELGSQGLSLRAESETELADMLALFCKNNYSWIVDPSEACDNIKEYDMLESKPTELKDDSVLWIIPVYKNESIAGCLLIGTETHSHWSLNWETRDFLNAISQNLYRYLEAQFSQQKLNENAQLLAFSQMSAFVTHDMKNVYAQIKMITSNAKEHRHNEEFVDDVFDDLQGMEARIKKMLDQLTNKQRKVDNTSNNLVQVKMVLDRVVSNPTTTKLGIRPQLNSELTDKISFLGDEERFENVLKHLIENAQQACANSSKPSVSLTCHYTDKHVIIFVIDNGVGMSQEFIETRLFKPFETTKGNAGMGLGVYDAKTFAEDHKGSLKVDSHVGKGSTITLTLPRSGNEITHH